MTNAYAWHEKMMLAVKAGTQRPPIHENEPQCGWFMRRTERDGPMRPARIFHDLDSGEMRCEVGGQRRDVGSEWTWLAGRPISEDDYMALLALAFKSEDAAHVERVECGDVQPVSSVTAPTTKTVF